MTQEQKSKSWDELAGEYVTGAWLGEYIEIPTIREKFRGKLKGLQLLDVACGYGKHAKFFCEEGAHVTGVDNADEMIVLAKRLVPEATFYCTPAQNLSLLGKKQFDLIVAIFLFPNIQNVDDFHQCLVEMHAHLSPKGRLVIYDRHPIAFCATDSELTKVVPPQGAGYYDNGCQFDVHLRLKDDSWIRFKNYHWTFEHWHTQLHKAGFVLRSLTEPKPVNVSDSLAKAFTPFFKQPLHMMIECERS